MYIYIYIYTCNIYIYIHIYIHMHIHLRNIYLKRGVFVKKNFQHTCHDLMKNLAEKFAAIY